MPRFVRNVAFAALSVKDLLEARDQYHVHLANLENVIGTAIGRYRIRDSDPNARDPDADSKGDLEPRTLTNSSVKRWSWPCVLVFVDRWASPTELARNPESFVPPRLYLPDGRVVPTCVIYAERRPPARTELAQVAFSSSLLGGGYPVLTDEQGKEKLGSIGCLVTDGFYTYALTSSHVVGEANTPLYTVNHGVRQRIGIACGRTATKQPFQERYPGLAGTRAVVNLDAGLVRVDDIEHWTSQVYGIGRIGQPINVNVDTLSLDLLGCPLKAYGGASGELEGEIQGLFYRYRSVGGTDYIAEFLIGPRNGSSTVPTRPGDSGTVWFWDAPDDSARGRGAARTPELQPIAVQWGGHSFMDEAGQGVRQFALASAISSVCQALDVEVIRDWETDLSLYWGKVGHYKIAYSACFLAAEEKLDLALRANAELIGVADKKIEDGDLPKATTGNTFVPLADVADLVWRSTRGKDKANHFADMDEEGRGKFKGRTLLKLWSTKTNRTTKVWTEFYDLLVPSPKDQHRGALPFRVKQMYAEMVGFVKQKQLTEYVCAAGLVAHYVGDACQPLHVSHLHHGEDESESGVHSKYETAMLDRFAAEVVSGVQSRLKSKKVTHTFKGGDAAAHAVVGLMKRTFAKLPPQEVLDSYNRNTGSTRLKMMWEELGPRTLDVLSDGALTLAQIWESAWREGGGNQNFTEAACRQLLSREALTALYMNKEFCESDWLKNM